MAPRIFSSLTIKLGVLIGVFVALPILLYNQFETADRDMRELVTSGIYHQNWLIAQALRPALNQLKEPAPDLDEQLFKYTTDGTALRLMFRPVRGRKVPDFLFVASAPPLPASEFNAELDRMTRAGVLQHLSPACTWLTSSEIARKIPGGHDQLLTSMIPIKTRAGCWVLVASHVTSDFLNMRIGQPYWRQPETHLALLIYLAMAAVVALMIWSVWLHIRRFRRIVRAVRRGRLSEYAFSDQNRIPELANAAADFDQLVLDLRGVARSVRESAEENAHSFKAPVATIEASLAPLQRLAAPDDKRAERALALINSSLSRLKTLVDAAQRVDNVTADLVDAPRSWIEFSDIVTDIATEFREQSAGRRIDFKLSIEPGIAIFASDGALDLVVENLVENALSFSPPGGSIQIDLHRTGTAVELRVADDGPGFDPAVIDRVFDRYFCSRPPEDKADTTPGIHAGLGLWIVKRHAENLGGDIVAGNRAGGGACVTITLPAPRRRGGRIEHLAALPRAS